MAFTGYFPSPCLPTGRIWKGVGGRPKRNKIKYGSNSKIE
jgi:hypothetical protein